MLGMILKADAGDFAQGVLDSGKIPGSRRELNDAYNELIEADKEYNLGIFDTNMRVPSHQTLAEKWRKKKTPSSPEGSDPDLYEEMIEGDRDNPNHESVSQANLLIMKDLLKTLVEATTQIDDISVKKRIEEAAKYWLKVIQTLINVKQSEQIDLRRRGKKFTGLTAREKALPKQELVLKRFLDRVNNGLKDLTKVIDRITLRGGAFELPSDFDEEILQVNYIDLLEEIKSGKIVSTKEEDLEEGMEGTEKIIDIESISSPEIKRVYKSIKNKLNKEYIFEDLASGEKAKLDLIELLDVLFVQVKGISRPGAGMTPEVQTAIADLKQRIKRIRRRKGKKMKNVFEALTDEQEDKFMRLPKERRDEIIDRLQAGETVEMGWFD